MDCIGQPARSGGLALLQKLKLRGSVRANGRAAAQAGTRL